jgi:hypothetical protein
MKRILALWLAVAVVLSIPCAPAPTVAASQIYSLKGLQGLAVGIAELPTELKELGLREEDVYRAVADRLEAAGLAIRTDRYAIAGEPDFLVDIFGGQFVQGIITYCINIRLEQPVIIERDRTLRTIASTWSQQFIGVVGFGTDKGVVMENLLALVDLFVEEHHSVNEP